MEKVAIYCRESTERQDISTLISMCEKAAHELGFNTPPIRLILPQLFLKVE